MKVGIGCAGTAGVMPELVGAAEDVAGFPGIVALAMDATSIPSTTEAARKKRYMLGVDMEMYARKTLIFEG